MPAVQEIISTLNKLAYGWLPADGLVRRPGRSVGRPRARQPVPDPSQGMYAHAGVEPLLEDVLQDPVVQLMMRADHVEPTEVRQLLVACPASSRARALAGSAARSCIHRVSMRA